MTLEDALLPEIPAAIAMAATMLVWLIGLLFVLGKKRLALHDRLTKTRVVYGSAAPAPGSERRG